jgi:hypothetical protein
VEEENARAARELACRRGRSSHREETVIQLKDENPVIASNTPA